MCRHLQPFCLKSLHDNQLGNTSQCSLCGGDLNSLVMDNFIDSLLSVCSEDTVHVNIFSDGRFEELSVSLREREEKGRRRVVLTFARGGGGGAYRVVKRRQ